MKFLSLALIMFSLSSQADNLTIDVSGRDGYDARHGIDGNSYGEDGTDAGQASPGQDAGDIDITLSEGPGDTLITSGSHARTMRIGTSGTISLIARGGRGGNGGHGGNGARGAPGRDGRDATRTSDGTNGGNGGPGGDGGRGSRGANGGDGGRVTIRVNESDMNLLYLVSRPDVSAGPGGAAGRNGSGGAGGPGGSGGSSYSWREPYTVSKTCDRRDCDGNGTCVTVTYDCSYTDYHEYSNSGGSSGWSGSSGSSGSAAVGAGAPGRNGSYQYVVAYRDGRTVAYNDRFELQLVGFDVGGEFNDRFVEPGERITLRNIRIRNVGGMPSPTGGKVRLRAYTAQGVIEAHTTIDIGSIEPGQTAAIPDSVEATISPMALLANGDAVNHEISISGEILGIRRYFNFTGTKRTLNVRYPLSISRYLGRSGLAGGGSTLYRWAIDNFANRGIGADSRRAYLEVTLVPGQGLSPSSVTFEPRDAQRRADGVYVQAVTPLDPARGSQRDETELYRALVGFSSSARPGATARLRITLRIQDPHRPDVFHVAQVQEHELRVGRAFRGSTAGADMLLVINASTTPDEVDAWRQTARAMGRIMDVWDVSVEGAPDFTVNGLAERYRNGTVVLLNQDVDPADATTPADSYLLLASDQSLSTARRHGISFLILDETGTYMSEIGEHDSLEARTVDSPMLFAVPSAQRFSPAQIQSAAMMTRIFMADSFHEKLIRFQRYARGTNAPLLDAAAAAIVQDLASEQLMALSFPESQAAGLPLLTFFCRWGVARVVAAGNESAAYAQAMARIVASLQLLSESQARGMPWSHERAIVNRTEVLLEAFLERRFADRAAAENAVANISRSLNEEIRRTSSEFRESDSSRLFTYGRSWAGYYNSRAVINRVLAPSFEGAYVDDLNLLESVLRRRTVPTVQ